MRLEGEQLFDFSECNASAADNDAAFVFYVDKKGK